MRTLRENLEGHSAFSEEPTPGARQSEHQREFQRQLEAAGGRYILATSLDSVMAELQG